MGDDRNVQAIQKYELHQCFKRFSSDIIMQWKIQMKNMTTATNES